MNTKTQPSTNAAVTTVPSTDTHLLPDLDPSGASARPTFQELLEKHHATLNAPTVPWSHPSRDASASPLAIYQNDSTKFTPRPLRWLWQNRLPLSGITLLDGDHACGKTLLAHQIAAAVSSGASMPDGTPTIQGGVVIITPYDDASSTQLQLLTALGADLSRIQFLSFIKDETEDYHPFSLTEDLHHLFTAIERVDARLIIFDPFISLLARSPRFTERHLNLLLTEFNQQLIKHNIACLLIRNCPARGGHARPSTLEKSNHLTSTALSHLLLTPDPIQPDQLCLCHVKSRRIPTPTPTLTFQIQPMPANPELPYITIQGTHRLLARDFLMHRPDTLHHQILIDHIRSIITAEPAPMHVTTLYPLLPYASIFQIQRALSFLLRAEELARPARGFYTKATPIATTPQNTQPVENPTTPAAKSESTQLVEKLTASAATKENTKLVENIASPVATSKSVQSVENRTTLSIIKENIQPVENIKIPAAKSESTQPVENLTVLATINEDIQSVGTHTSSAVTRENTQPIENLTISAATKENTQPVENRTTSAATKENTQPVGKPTASAAIREGTRPVENRTSPAAIPLEPELVTILSGLATITLDPELANILNGIATATLDPELTDLVCGLATTPQSAQPVSSFNETSAIPLEPELATILSGLAAITLDPELANILNGIATATLDPGLADLLKCCKIAAL